MEHDFFEMYLEEMGDIAPLTREERTAVLEGTAKIRCQVPVALIWGIFLFCLFLEN